MEELAAVEGLIPKANSNGSGGWVLQAEGGSARQRARWRFDGPAGLYSLRVRYFDEDDAASRLSVMVDGAVVDSWVWDAGLGDNRANRATLTSHEIRRVALVPGSCLLLAGEAAADEPLRLDAVEVIPEAGGWCVAKRRRPRPAAGTGARRRARLLTRRVGGGVAGPGGGARCGGGEFAVDRRELCVVVTCTTYAQPMHGAYAD